MTARAPASGSGSAHRLDTAAASPTGVVAWYAQGFADRLGDRLLLFDNTGAEPLELLRLAQRLTNDPAFEPALRERVEELKPFRHPAFARVRGVSVLAEPTPQLALVSDHIAGERLSQILRAARAAGFKPDPGTALWLVRQLMPAVAALHEMGAEIAHGTLSPDRIIVTPTGDLVVTEYVFAHALERIDATPADLWRELGVAVSPSAGRPDQRGDIEQVALLALAVLLGRPLGADEYPRRVRQLLDDACDAKRWSLVPPLRTWLTRALALTPTPFSSATEALETLDQLLPRVSGMWASRLLPQNVTAPPGASVAPATQPPREPRPAAAPAPTELPSAVGRPDAEVRPGAEVRPAPRVPPSRGPASILVPPAEPAPLSDTTRRITAAADVSPAADTHRRLWLLCVGLAGVALLEAVCLVIVLSATRGADSAARGPSNRLLAAPSPAATEPGARAVGSGEGWLTVESPAHIEVYVDDQFMGAGTDLRFALPAGRHVVSLTSEPLGFRSTQRIDLDSDGLIRLRPDVQAR